MCKKLTDAPCIFCGYNGPEYYRRGSHAADCPWHSIGEQHAREVALDYVVRQMFEEVRGLRAELAGLRTLARAAMPDRNDDCVIEAALSLAIRIGRERMPMDGQPA